MANVTREYPEELQKVIHHAQRFAKVLSRMEEATDADPWAIGRSGELRAVLSSALADWRSGTSDKEKTRAEIGGYLENLHRSAWRHHLLEGAPECCGMDEAVTVVPRKSLGVGRGDAGPSSSAGAAGFATEEAGWADGPNVLGLFHAELDRVTLIARMMARFLGTTCVTLDDLEGFGREGLLDAARSFDERHGVPFAHWAALRIRSAMIDGVRRWGNLPRRLRRELRAIQAADFAAEGLDEARFPKAGLDGDRALGRRLGTMGTAMAVVALEDDAEGLGGVGLSPEEMLARAELQAIVRQIVAELPEPERELVERHHFRGETLDQAAAVVGRDKFWAKRVEARAMKKIQAELRRRAIDVEPAIDRGA
jgi:RNA polymerase sigma factor for flagellar operon FliA